MKTHIYERLTERIGIMMQAKENRFTAEQVAKSEAVEMVCTRYKLKRAEAEQVVSEVLKTLPKE